PPRSTSMLPIPCSPVLVAAAEQATSIIPYTTPDARTLGTILRPTALTSAQGTRGNGDFWYTGHNNWYDTASILPHTRRSKLSARACSRAWRRALARTSTARTHALAGGSGMVRGFFSVRLTASSLVAKRRTDYHEACSREGNAARLARTRGKRLT